MEEQELNETMEVEQKVEEPVQEVVNKKEKKKDKKKPVWRKVLDWVITGVFGALIVGAIGFNIASSMSKEENNFIFDRIFPVVLTDSMCPDYPVNSVLVVKKVDPSEIKVGDDVTFRWVVNEEMTNMTHRISEIEIREDLELGQGRYRFTAHGINTHSEFCKIGDEYADCTNQLQHFTENSLVGKVERRDGFLTVAFTVIRSPWGLVVLVLIPALYLVVSSVIDMFRKIPDDDETPQLAGGGSGGNSNYTYVPKDGEDPLAGLSEEEKEKLKQELLAELLGEGGKD